MFYYVMLRTGPETVKRAPTALGQAGRPARREAHAESVPL